MDAKRPTNRLALEVSPYLLQHAHNPVEWYPWGDEAFERAVIEDKPILLSIGYAACHWCHVMERESFADEALASFMNDNFVCIKVDREERPDVDGIYMSATVALNGTGGWPMTVFLTPQREPFFAGTYFPPEDRWGRPGFRTLLTRIADLWAQDRTGLIDQAAELTRVVCRGATPAQAGPVGQVAIDRAAAFLARTFDTEHGGFGNAPKFPPHAALELLLREVNRTGNARAAMMVRRTLDAMGAGGIHDHVGGGFARYSTDARWLVPHFEKMLYDNAQLARTYAEASVVFADPHYEVLARSTFDFVLREMRHPEGGFFTSMDADSAGEEGRYYVWSFDELASLLGPTTTAHVAAYFGVTEEGNWEGKNVLHVGRPLRSVADSLQVHPADLEESLARATELLREAREAREAPKLDDKVVTAHCALMIGALAEGSRLLRDQAYREAAERAARFVLHHLRGPGGDLLRVWRAGKARVPGFLEDYAYFADALIDLYEAGGSSEYLFEARRLGQRLVQRFSIPDGGGFFESAADHTGLPFRARAPHDGAMPSATAVAARALLRLGNHFHDEILTRRAHAALEAQREMLNETPQAALSLLSTIDAALRPPVELVLIGSPGSDAYRELEDLMAGHYLPSRTITRADPDAGEKPHFPLTTGREAVGGRPTLYVCCAGTCEAPITEPGRGAAAFRNARDRGADLRSVEVGTPKLAGLATAAGTARLAARFSDRFPPGAFQMLAELRVSRLGLAAPGAPLSRSPGDTAWEELLTSGINLVDVAARSADEDAETVLGQVLASLVRTGRIARDELVLVATMGQLRGSRLAAAQARQRDGRPYPGVAKLSESLWHCIHPDWLRDQLRGIRERLGVHCLDVALIGEPELLLTQTEPGDEAQREQAADRVYDELGKAFAFLEAEVEDGRLRFYGVSSSAFAGEPNEPGLLSLERVMDVARTTAGQGHHFRVIRVPLNLLESQAALVQNQWRHGVDSLIGTAGVQGVAVLGERPLLAMWCDALLNLGQVIEAPRASAATLIAELEDREREFQREFAPHLRIRGDTMAPTTLFTLAPLLGEALRDARAPGQIEELYLARIAPRLAATVHAIDRAFQTGDGRSWETWKDRYLRAFSETVDAVRYEAGRRTRKTAAILDEAITPDSGDSSSVGPFHKKALWLLSHVDGVCSTLVDVTTEAQPEDLLDILELTAPRNAASAMAAAAGQRPQLRDLWERGQRH